MGCEKKVTDKKLKKAIKNCEDDYEGTITYEGKKYVIYNGAGSSYTVYAIEPIVWILYNEAEDDDGNILYYLYSYNVLYHSSLIQNYEISELSKFIHLGKEYGMFPSNIEITSASIGISLHKTSKNTLGFSYSRDGWNERKAYDLNGKLSDYWTNDYFYKEPNLFRKNRKCIGSYYVKSNGCESSSVSNPKSSHGVRPYITIKITK